MRPGTGNRWVAPFDRLTVANNADGLGEALSVKGRLSHREGTEHAENNRSSLGWHALSSAQGVCEAGEIVKLSPGVKMFFRR